MQKRIFFLLLIVLLSGCGSQASSDAAAAVEHYYQALAARDEAALSNLSCASWEEQALLEYDSFAGVEVALDGVTCRETGAQDGTSQVACDGKLVATYGNEQMDFPLTDRLHQVVNEAGDWRICGY